MLYVTVVVASSAVPRGSHPQFDICELTKLLTTKASALCKAQLVQGTSLNRIKLETEPVSAEKGH